MQADAIKRRLVRRINARLAAGRFLVAWRRAGTLVGYCMASGDPATASYEVAAELVDLVDLARRLGLQLSPGELTALGAAVAA